VYDLLFVCISIWGGGTSSTGVKWGRREADHSPPSTAEVKNVWS